MTAGQGKCLLCSQEKGRGEGGRSGPVIGLLGPVIWSGQAFPKTKSAGSFSERFFSSVVFFCCTLYYGKMFEVAILGS